MGSIISDFAAWLLSIVVSIFTAFFTLLGDVLIWLIDQLLAGLIWLLGYITVPQFITDGINAFWLPLDDTLTYFLSAAGVIPALAMIGVGYLFRLTRKVLTLFQW